MESLVHVHRTPHNGKLANWLSIRLVSLLIAVDSRFIEACLIEMEFKIWFCDTWQEL